MYKMQRGISPWTLLLTAIGGIIGSGWLLGPLYAAKIAGSGAVLAWVIGGVLMSIIALTFAELATLIPLSGSMVRFAEITHGTFTSFSIAWISWLASLMVAPIEAMAALQYLSTFIPGLVNLSHEHPQLSKLGILVATALMGAMCLLNYYGVKLFNKSANVLSCIKIIIPFIIIAALFIGPFSMHTLHLSTLIPSHLHGTFKALPEAGIIFSYIGFSPVIQLAGDAKNPQKAIPFAIISAMILAIIIYSLTQLAFMGSLSPSDLANGYHHLSFKGQSGPLAGLLMNAGLLALLPLIYLQATLSPIGTALIYTASSARINVGMVDNGYMHPFNAKTNHHGMPYGALLVNFIVGMLFFLPFPGWHQMVSFLVSCFVLAYLIGPISCASLRQAMPDLARPFKVPYYRLFTRAAFFICSLLLYWSTFAIISKMMLCLLIGYGYLLWNKGFSAFKTLDLQKGLWLIFYLFSMLIISYLGRYGGMHILKGGSDISAIFLISMISFQWAISQTYSASQSAENFNYHMQSLKG